MEFSAPLRRSQSGLWLSASVILLSATAASAADTYELREPNAAVAMRVSSHVEIEGHFLTPSADGKAVKWPVRSVVDYEYVERRIDGTGRDAENLRSLRYYKRAESQTTVGQRQTSQRLGDALRLLVAQGRTSHVELYSTSSLMTRNDLDLLGTPGDTLAALALQPRNRVELNEEWNQLLTGTEAVTRSELVCSLDSVTRGTARISFRGSIEGATLGAAARTELDGHFEFRIGERYVSRFELRQSEKRSVGTVSPGLEVVANCVWQRQPDATQSVITDEVADTIPVNPGENRLALSFRSPWKARLVHDRNWHVFHQTPEMCVLRLVERGRLITQCNISRVETVAPGARTPREQFETDVRRELGPKLGEITESDRLAIKGGRFLYRVIGTGRVNDNAMTWRYYLCTAVSGRQIAFAFSTATEDLGKLSDRDIAMVRSMEFFDGSRFRSATRP